MTLSSASGITEPKQAFILPGHYLQVIVKQMEKVRKLYPAKKKTTPVIETKVNE